MNDLSRRSFMTTGLALLSSAAFPILGQADTAPVPASIALVPLPYDQAALAPIISATTLGIHYGRHHKGYLDNLNKLIAGTPAEGAPVETIMRANAGKANAAEIALFNNSAQVWNHTFYWNNLSPNGGAPSAKLKAVLEASFGSMDAFRAAFLNGALTQFGSGWAWLVLDKPSDKLIIVKSGNADTPAVNPQQVPLAVIDVWEHAYYLDYQNKRMDYAAALYDKLLNWRFVEENFERARA